MKEKIIISLICLIIWIILVIFNKLEWFDESIYIFLSNFNSDALTNVMKVITAFANTKTIVLLTVLSLASLCWKDKKCFYIIYTIILSTILNNILKLIIKRERPTHYRYIIEKTYSFPSGHAMASICFYGSIIVLIINSKLDKKYKYLITIFLSILIFFIGISRIYLGVHHASDIIGGWLIGMILLIILNKKVKEKDYESINYWRK